jgi:putative resolvase
MEGFYSGKQAAEMLNVCQATLRNWERDNRIEIYRTPGNKRMYNVGKFMKDNNIRMISEVEEDERLIIGYVRVSSAPQSNDLIRQEEELKRIYPNITIIKDVGSGLSLTKRGILRIIEMAIAGRIEKLIVLYKDRLARYGYDLIEFFVREYSKGEIIIVHQPENTTVEEELVKDVMNILNIYTAKMNGIRKYNKFKDEKERQ